jgi:hypothetical protein
MLQLEHAILIVSCFMGCDFDTFQEPPLT